MQHVLTWVLIWVRRDAVKLKDAAHTKYQSRTKCMMLFVMGVLSPAHNPYNRAHIAKNGPWMKIC